MPLDRKTQRKILDAHARARAAALAAGEDPTRAAENEYSFPWSTTAFGSDGRALYVHERSDRPGEVRVRFQATPEEAAKRECPRRPRLAVPVDLRDERGRLLRRATDRAVEAAKQVYEDWLSPVQAQPSAGPYFRTYREVFQYYLDTCEMGERHRKGNVGSLDDPPESKTAIAEWRRRVGLDEDVSTFGFDLMRRVTLELVGEYDNGRGATKAVRIFKVVLAAINHAKANGRLPADVAVAPPRWEKTIRETWSKRHGVSVTRPRRPRYSEHEAIRLLQHLDEAEPRLRLAIELTLGYRVEQVTRRATRKSLLEGGAFGLQLVFLDQKSMREIKIDLSPRQQRALREAWAPGGVLNELEHAYQHGHLEDYYLVPSGRLRNGVAQRHGAASPYTDLLKRLRELETIAGVPHETRRAFHGLRRTVARLVNRETEDDTLRDLAQGWTPGSGARELYDDALEDEEQLALAAQARARAIESVARSLTPAEQVEDLAAIAQDVVGRIEGTREADDRTADALTEAVYLATCLTDALRQAAGALEGLPARERVSHRRTRREQHEALEAEVRGHLDRLRLTGVRAAQLLMVSDSDISAIRRAKSCGLVSFERLTAIRDQLAALPES